MSPKLTACEQCAHYRYWLYSHFCVAHEKDVFNPLKGCVVKESDMSDSIQAPRTYCNRKNKGDCPDFETRARDIP